MTKRSEPASMGDNSGEVNAGHLRAFIERIERVNAEIADLTSDRKEILAEAKSQGFDPKIIRKIISMRAMDADKRAEEEALIALYMDALGDLASTPLGKAAIERAVA